MAVSAVFRGSQDQAQPLAQELSGNLVTVRQPISNWQYIYGRRKVGGALTFGHETTDGKVHLVITFAGHQCAAIEGVWFNDELIVLDGSNLATGKWAKTEQATQQGTLAGAPYQITASNDVTGVDNVVAVLADLQITINDVSPAAPSQANEYSRSGNVFTFHSGIDTYQVTIQYRYASSKVRIQYSLGDEGASQPFPDLVTESEGKWTSAHLQRGRTKIYVRLTPDGDLFPTGIPNITALIRGKKVYDSRTATTIWTDNASLCINDFLCDDPAGLEAVYADEIDETQLIAAANEDDEDVACNGAGNYYTFTADASSNKLTLTLYSAEGYALRMGDEVEVALVSGASLPGGLAAATAYYAIPQADGTIKVATSLANARAGTAVDITSAGSGTFRITLFYERRYSLNGAFLADAEPIQTLRKLLTANAGYVRYIGGVFRIHSAVYTAPTITFDEGDLRGVPAIEPKLSAADLYNGVKGVFVSEENNWQNSDFPPVMKRVTAANITVGAECTILTVGTTDFTLIGAAANTVGVTFTATGAGTGTGTVDPYLGQDAGERSWLELTLPFTHSPIAAQRIGKIELERNRQQITVEWKGKFTCYRVQAGDTAGITFGMLGWTAKVFEVMQSGLAFDQDAEGNPILGSDLLLRETASAVYDWTVANDESTYDPAPDTDLPDPFLSSGPPTGVAASSGTADLLQGADGTVISRIKVTWDAATDQFVLNGGHVWTAYKPAGTVKWQYGPIVDGDQTQAYLSPVEDGVLYDVGVMFVNALSIGTRWTIITHTVVGKTAAPSDVTNFVVTERADGTREFSWDNPADADVVSGGHFEIRASLTDSVWADQTIGAGQPIIHNPFTSRSPTLVAGDWYFHIKAVDASGNSSANATPASAHPKTLALAPSGPILNANITVDGDGKLAGSGTPTALVDNTKITVQADGSLANAGTGTTKVANEGGTQSYNGSIGFAFTNSSAGTSAYTRFYGANDVGDAIILGLTGSGNTLLGARKAILSTSAPGGWNIVGDVTFDSGDAFDLSGKLTFTKPALSVPDMAYTYTETQQFTGGESKFGKWRQYFNAAEFGWGLVYNSAVDPHTVYPPAFAGRDSGDAAANICAMVRVDVAEGAGGQNFFGVEWAPGAAAGVAPDWVAAAAMYYYDGGMLRLRAPSGQESALTISSNDTGTLRSYTIRTTTDGTLKIQDTAAWQIANGSGVPPSSGTGIYDRVAIDASGNIVLAGPSLTAINTDAASSAGLIVQNDTTADVYLRTWGSGVGTSGWGQTLGNWSAVYSYGSASNGLIIGTATADPVIIGTNNAARLTIDSAGAATFSGTVNASNLAITAGQTLTVTTGGTLGSAAYTASSAYDAAGAASTVQTNLTTHTGQTGTAVHGLGTASTYAATAFATAAQGTTADAAMPRAGGTFSGAVDITYATPTLTAATNSTTGYSIVRAKSDADAMASLSTYGSASVSTAFGQTLANWSLLYANGAASNGLIIGTATADPVIIGTNNAACITVNSSGAVQAETANNVTGLTVKQTGTYNVGLSLYRSGGTASQWDMYSPAGSTDLRLYYGADRLTLTSAGALTVPGAATLNGTAIPASSTLLVSGGALGTPSSGALTNCTFPTLNQNTSGTAANLSGTPNISVGTISASGSVSFSTTNTGLAMDADSKALSLAGGSAPAPDNGGYVVAYGNTHASNPGEVRLNSGTAGANPDADIICSAPASTERMRIVGARSEIQAVAGVVFRAMSGTVPSGLTGSSVEVGFNSAGPAGYINSYNRDSSTALPLSITSSAVSMTGTLGVSDKISNGTGTTTTAGLQIVPGLASGYVGLGAENLTLSTTNYALVISTAGTTVNLNAATGGTVSMRVNNSARIYTDGTTATIADAIRGSYYGAGTATFDASGNITSSSDPALKTDIAPYAAGLAEVIALANDAAAITYRHSPYSGLDTEDEYAGFDASIVEKYLPHAVGRMNGSQLTMRGKPIPGHRTLNHAPIIAALVNAVAQLAATIH